MGNSRGNRWLAVLQYIVASCALAFDLFAIFDLVNFNGYSHYSNVTGPTAAVIMSNPQLLSLSLWLLGICAGAATFCAVLCKNHRLATCLAILATVCIAFVMFIGWADLNARSILGYAPTNFYLVYVISHGLLAVASGRLAHQARFAE